MKNNNIIKNIFVLIIFIIIFISIGHYVATFIGKQKEKEIRSDIYTTAKTISTSLSAEKFKNISSTVEDNSNPDYLYLREKMIEIGNANKEKGVRWIYTVVPRDGEIIFSVDSVTDENHSEPGDVYAEASDEFISAVNKAWDNSEGSFLEPYTDRWGTFISVLVPIKDLEHNTVSVLGIDIDYTNYYLKSINDTKNIPYLITIIFIIIFCLSYTYLIIIRNLGDQEKAEKIRYKYGLEGVGDGLWDWNLVTNEVFFSKRWKKMLGYEDNEIKGDFSEWEKRVHPDDLEAAKKLLKEHIDGVTKTYECVHRLMCKNGEYKWIGSRGKVVDFSKSGKPLRIVGSHTDLDSTKKLEIELKNKVVEFEKIKTASLNVLEDIAQEKEKYLEISDKLKLATKSARIGILELDLRNNLMIGDDITCEIYELPHGEMNGVSFDNWKKFVVPEGLPLVEKAIKDLLVGGKPFEQVFRIITKSGERYIKGYASVKKDEFDRPERMVGVNIDVTREFEIDKAKTEFVSLVSHQLKTPVGAISWSAEMLLDGDYGKLGKKQIPIIEEIYKMNRRMADLVNGFLNISRIELGTFAIETKEVVFKDLCEDVLKEMNEKVASQNMTIEKEYENNMPATLADTKLLTIIFQNLLSNAIKYGDKNSAVKIFIGLRKNDIIIEVRNAGNPIPEQDQSKIFQKLFRASNAQSMDPNGNGLGLYLLKSIVESAGGSVAFKSNKKIGGTVFTVSFPLPGMKPKEGTKHLN